MLTSLRCSAALHSVSERWGETVNGCEKRNIKLFSNRSFSPAFPTELKSLCIVLGLITVLASEQWITMSSIHSFISIIAKKCTHARVALGQSWMQKYCVPIKWDLLKPSNDGKINSRASNKRNAHWSERRLAHYHVNRWCRRSISMG